MRRSSPPVPAARPARSGAADESLPVLLGQLVRALLATVFDRLPVHVINRIIAVCGLLALVAPLLLWFSWSKAGFFIIIGGAALAVGIIYLFSWLYPEDPY